METVPVNIGIIGAGGIAISRHLPNLAKLPEVRFVAVANRSVDNAKRVAEQFGFDRVYEDWKSVIDDSDVQAVFICTPPYMHAEMTRYAIAKGKHVFCQARMALDLEDAKTMWEADQQSSLTTMLCPGPNYMSVEAYVLELIADGKIGEIRHVLLTHPSDMFADPEQPLHWRQRKNLQGINVLDVGIMGELLAKWFGPISQVEARAKTWVAQRQPDADGHTQVELPDSCTVIGEFSSGAMLTALFTGAVKGGASRMSIHGTLGTITCFPFEKHILINTGNGDERLEVEVDSEKLWTVEADFIQAIKSGTKGYPSFQEGLAYMGFTQAVMESAGWVR